MHALEPHSLDPQMGDGMRVLAVLLETGFLEFAASGR
ncbi:hypothetical protein XVE_1118 [Xanthomonas vesicatoria ATCC 35937]|uniref:Uncharacterized protein n=1 Tax=Xanthomonas vesicatoria ATCC 35937 TaxID=925775 RepID=F0BAK9_9XANT|nr:hypothetical protein XVE_1118 [Xanthomonas vesicatoria ATCC 35937]